MQYVGIQTQQRRNNIRSLILLFLFPCLVIGLVFLFCYLLTAFTHREFPANNLMELSGILFSGIAPYIIAGIVIWFIIAYFANTKIISSATKSHPLERKNNKRVYNLVENLCMAQGMKMPKINVIGDNSLNAFASGINDQTYTITLSQGIITKLNDEELEAVIAHELSHIRNRDVRLLIVSIVFVGIFSMIAAIAWDMIYYSSRSVRNKRDNKAIFIIILVLIIAAIGYFFTTLMRFAISRKREYLADAGAAEMTRNPQALANALRKISKDPDIEAVRREDVAQLFIEHPGKHAKSAFSRISGLFATHPPIERRIQVLEQF